MEKKEIKLGQNVNAEKGEKKNDQISESAKKVNLENDKKNKEKQIKKKKTKKEKKKKVFNCFVIILCIQFALLQRSDT